MQYISVSQFAEKYGISERTARNYCAMGKIDGAFMTGKTWNIPADAMMPKRSKRKVAPLLAASREQKEMQMKGGIYHRIQIDLTYNSNHIEGSRLSKEQTRFIFETNTLGVTHESTNIDDIMETVNHFRCIDYVIEHAIDKITETHIKQLHFLLKNNTSDSRKPWFAVGDYKLLPNEVGGRDTTPPEDVAREMQKVIASYESLSSYALDDVIAFHVAFERIHPFQDGNGRVGRLVMFKECLRHAVTPFVISDDMKLFYYRGLAQWDNEKGWLRDTCLSAQDTFKEWLDYYRIPYSD